MALVVLVGTGRVSLSGPLQSLSLVRSPLLNVAIRICVVII